MQPNDNNPEEINGPAKDSQPIEHNDKKPVNEALRKKLRMLTMIVIGLGVIAGLMFYIHGLSYESSNDAFIDGDIIPISARVSSYVTKVYVAANQRVKSGDLLVELDPEDYRAQLNLAQAELAAAKAVNQYDIINIDLMTVSSTSDLDSAQAEFDYASASLAEAESDLKSLEVHHQQDKTDLARYRKMGDSITAQQLDHAVSSEKVSAADVESAQRKVIAKQAMVRQAEVALTAAKTAPQRIEQTRSRADVSSADIHKATAALKQAELKLSYTRIYAPCDGYVTKKNAEPGAYVQSGQVLMAIVSPDVWVTANFKETQLTHMSPGQPATISVDAYPGVEFTGHVKSIQHGTGSRFSLLPPENATGNYVKVVQRVPVKIVFDDYEQTQKYLLAPGMSAVPEVNIKEKGQTLNQQPPSPVQNADTGSKSSTAYLK
jgi:membrane fusion protein (multidrug efflux system)